MALIRGYFNSVYLKVKKETVLALSSVVSSLPKNAIAEMDTQKTTGSFPRRFQRDDIYYLQTAAFNAQETLTEFNTLVEKVSGSPEEPNPARDKQAVDPQRRSLLWIK